MPRLIVDIADTYENVTRPVATGVLNDILRYTNMDEEIELVLRGDDGDIPNKGSQLNTDKDLDFTAKNKLFVTINETFDPDIMLGSSVAIHHNPKVFSDPDLGAYITPEYMGTILTMTCEYIAENRNDADKWINEFRRRAGMGLRHNLHNVDYVYHMQAHHIMLLEEIFRLRENYQGHGDTLGEYIKDHTDERMTVFTNTGGTQSKVGFKEKQVGINGYFDFDNVPEKDVERDNDKQHKVSFTYTVKYQRVTSVVMEYPIFVHNQMIDSMYVDFTHNYNVPLMNLLKSASTHGFDELFRDSHARPQVKSGYSVPAFDDWFPTTIVNGTTTLARVAIRVEPTKPKTVLNLYELGDVAFADWTRPLLESEREHITKPYCSVFNVTLYKGDQMVDFNKVSCDENMNIVLDNDLDPRGLYHVRISMVNDLTRINSRGIEALLAYGEVTQNILVNLAPDLISRGMVPELFGKRMKTAGFWEAVRFIKTTNPVYSNGIEVNRYTVSNMLVVAHNQENSNG